MRPPGPSTARPESEDNLRLTDNGRYSSLQVEGGQIVVAHDGRCERHADITCPGPEIDDDVKCDEGEAEPCSEKVVRYPPPSCNPPPPERVPCPKALRLASNLAKQ